MRASVIGALSPGCEQSAEGAVIENSSDRQVQSESQIMMNLDQVTPREQQILNLLVQGFSNKEIGGELNISLRTVKQHLRTLFLRTGIREGSKRVKLACYAYEDESEVMTPCEGLNPTEIQISTLVWEGLRAIAKLARSSAGHLTNLESGVGWNWLCTWPAMAEKIGLPRPSATIPWASSVLSRKYVHIVAGLWQRSNPR
jgi:DNA-binding CsgD family transcriptional regulator